MSNNSKTVTKTDLILDALKANVSASEIKEH